MFNFYRANGRKDFPAIITVPSTGGVTYKVGDALALSSGGAVKATGTTHAAYVCAQEYVAPSTGNKDIVVYPILNGQEWETTFAADPASLVVGNKVTIHTDAEQVTATTASGTVEIVAFKEARAEGSKVIVKFT